MMGYAISCYVALVGGCVSDTSAVMQRANDLLYHQRYVASEKLYRKLLHKLDAAPALSDAQDWQRLVVLDRLGKINALYLRDFQRAVADYEALIQRYPGQDTTLSALLTVAELHAHKLGNVPGAIGAYQRVVSEFGGRPEARGAQLAIVSHYFRQKDYNQARLEADVLVHHWPHSAEATQAQFETADAYFGQKRFAEAIALYERLFADRQDTSLRALVSYELGNCYQEVGHIDRALFHYYAALAQHPNPQLVQSKIARVRARLHRLAPARRIMSAQSGQRLRRPTGADQRDDVGRVKSYTHGSKDRIPLAPEHVLAAPEANTAVPALPPNHEQQPQEPTEAFVPDAGAPQSG